MDNYVIINKTTIQKRIEELENKEPDWFKRSFEDNFKLNFLKEILSQSTSLIPMIEAAFDEGSKSGSKNWDSWTAPNIYSDKQDYISNLKLKI